MKIGQAIAAGFRSANEGWEIAAVSFCLGLGMSIGQRVLLPAPQKGAQANPAALIAGGLGVIVLALVLSMLWMVWFGGALTWLKSRLDGSENSSWSVFIEGGKRLFWGLCWVLSLQMLLIVAPLLVGAVLAGLLARVIGPVAALMLAAGAVGSFAFFVLWVFGPCSLAEKQQGAKVALKDSARFVRAHLGGTVGLLAALFLVGMGLLLAVMIPSLLLALLLKLPLSTGQQKLPLLLDVPLQAVAAYAFLLGLAAQYAYYRGNQEKGISP